jgi:hypothetical protein
MVIMLATRAKFLGSNLADKETLSMNDMPYGG